MSAIGKKMEMAAANTGGVVYDSYLFVSNNFFNRALASVGIDESFNLFVDGAYSDTATARATGVAYDSATQVVYLVSNGGDSISAIDVSTPGSPSLLDSFQPSSFGAGFVSVAIDTTNEVGYATIYDTAGTSDLVSFDISDPSNLSELDIFSGKGYAWGLSVDLANGVAYIVQRDRDRFVQAVNISNPSSLYLLSSVGLSSDSVDRLTFCDLYTAAGKESLIVCGDQGRIWSVDVGSPSSISEDHRANFSDGATYGVVVDTANSVAYLAAYGASIVRAIDVSNPSSLSSIGTVSLSGGPYSVQLDRNNDVLYAAGDSTGDHLSSIDVSTPASMSVIDTIVDAASFRNVYSIALDTGDVASTHAHT